MDPRPKYSGNKMDPGRRMAQLALRQAISSKLSLTSSFKREYDKKKKDKWKNKMDNFQEQGLKACLVPPEITDIMKIGESKTSVKETERKASSQNDQVSKGRGRGRGKPPSKQPGVSNVFGKKSETFIVPSTRLLHQLSSSSENDIPKAFTPLYSDFAACNTKTSLESDILKTNFKHKSQISILSASGDDFLNLSHMNEIRQKNLCHSDTHLSAISDQGYSSSSSLFFRDNKFSNLMPTRDFSLQKSENSFILDKQISIASDQGYSSSSSVFINDNNISLKEKENLFIHSSDQKYFISPSLKDTIPELDTSIKVCDNNEAISLKQNENNFILPFHSRYNSSENKVTDLFTGQSKSCIEENNLRKFNATQNDSHYSLQTISNQFPIPANLKGVFYDNDESESDLEISNVKSDNTYFSHCEEIEPEDKYIDELIDSFIDKPIDLSTGDSEDQYIDELIDSFIDKSDKNVNNLMDSFIGNPEDEYIDDLIDSFIGKKSNVLNEKTNEENTNVNFSKESFLADSCDILSLLSLGK
ncbi:MATH and LRR domain-containing protein PFE0570w isoform X2 [Parasteatoda tepidariorum]|uniref:MATH and LRR domain-containing protein PFE0570w isoform X2 n=1 Tax=Parasteatoda tepidariorum TaxID=114398 RepID=UPI00077F9936|nr:uncharacterized protein LOC107454942 isoform X2 [Parasteatoda tepidariorum]